MTSKKLIVPSPVISDRIFKKPLMCGPGPCDVSPEVAEALTGPVVSAMCDEYYNVMDDIRAGLRYLFQTRSQLVLAMSGSGHAGMEAVICNLLSTNDTLLIASRGIWDERAGIISTRYGIKTVTIQTSFDSTFTLGQLEAGLDVYRPTALFITHGDSSTGTLQNLEGIGDLCEKYGALLLVDTVVSIGGVPFFMDEWKVDAVYTSTQKVLSAPAGITPVAFGVRAEARINRREHEPPFYFDVKILAQQWNCHGNTRLYHHTLSPPLLWALRCSLKEISQETLPKLWARHANTAVHFHKRLREYGFEFLIPKPEDRLPTVTTVVLPRGYDYLNFVKYMVTNHNILIFAGLGPTKGKALRIGTMGVNSTVTVADAVAGAMADTLKHLTKASL